MSNADAARRLAFVVGINDYQNIPKLEKAVGDAKAMTAKLTDLGFDVTSILNPTRRTLNLSVSEFTAKLRRDDLVFVHFSGHGVEIDGDNILLPADVPKPKSNQKYAVKCEGIGLRRLIDQIASTGARTRVFVVDACRDNPFEQSGVRSVGSSRGLARIEAPSGTFIMYSAGYRQTALDKLGATDTEPTSVYTRVLLSKLDKPGKHIQSVAHEVRREVYKLANSVGHQQQPAYYDELSSQLVLKAALTKAEPAKLSKPAVATPSIDQELAVELAYWNSVKDSDKAALLQGYLSKYPNGRFADIAKFRLSEREQKPKSKKEQQTAALQPKPSEPEPEETKPAPVETPALSKRELTLRIQKQLVRHGCNPGKPDGAWGKRSRRALQAFARGTKKRLANLSPSQRLLDTLIGQKGRGCAVVCDRRHVAKGGRCVAKSCPRGSELSNSGRCVKSRVTHKGNSRDNKKPAKNKKQPVWKKANKAPSNSPKSSSSQQCGTCMTPEYLVVHRACGARYRKLLKSGHCL